MGRGIALSLLTLPLASAAHAVAGYDGGAEPLGPYIVAAVSESYGLLLMSMGATTLIVAAWVGAVAWMRRPRD
jgi:hypothetical protein